MDRGKEDCKQAAQANRLTLDWYWGRKADLGSGDLGLNGVQPMARLKQKKEKKGELGSGKPYDECSEVVVTLDIPVVSWGRRWDEGGEEERIRTEE